MHRDKNRNEFVPSLLDRQTEMAALPKSEGAELIACDNKLYQFIFTADGSPSIRMASVDQRPEAMHHSGGALTESLYIYGEALLSALEQNFPPTVLSVGLGCGYNEWIALGLCLNHRVDTSQILIESFENDPVLRSEFLAFVGNFDESPSTTAIPPELHVSCQKIFADVVRRVAESLRVDEKTLRQLGQTLVREGRWRLRDALDLETTFDRRFAVIFYDAFSSKATPTLWTDEFLDKFLHLATTTPCVFATYASTVTLKRALERARFELKNQVGFGGKRESTRAYRYGTVDPL